MRFVPRPENEFREFIEIYYQNCRQQVPEIEANAGKWQFEDLIPGLSDFDTRFIVSDSMTAAAWCRMSMEVGRVHLNLTKERKEWARNLEHLPGVNLRWNEISDPRQYFTEFSQWSFYHGDPTRLAHLRQIFADHPWTTADEAYHWKKIAIYYGPYNRTIDPAINLGVYENKYPLHSRFMHYIAPPVHSAICLLDRRTFPGKLEAMARAQHCFPEPQTMRMMLELIDNHYESDCFLTEPQTTELDNLLEKYLQGVVNTLLDQKNGLNCPSNPTPGQLKEATNHLEGVDPFSQLFENVKFARLMKGRLWFYGQTVLWFDSRLLIRNELNRIRANFFEIPVRFFVKLLHHVDVEWERALEMLEGDVLDRDQIEACRRFYQVAAPSCPESLLKQRALEIAAIFDPFLEAMEHLITRSRSQMSASNLSCFKE